MQISVVIVRIHSHEDSTGTPAFYSSIQCSSQRSRLDPASALFCTKLIITNYFSLLAGFNHSSITHKPNVFRAGTVLHTAPIIIIKSSFSLRKIQSFVAKRQAECLSRNQITDSSPESITHRQYTSVRYYHGR